MLYWWCVYLFFFKQKTAYERRISDWSSYVCSSDLPPGRFADAVAKLRSTYDIAAGGPEHKHLPEVGRRVQPFLWAMIIPEGRDAGGRRQSHSRKGDTEQRPIGRISGDVECDGAPEIGRAHV